MLSPPFNIDLNSFSAADWTKLLLFTDGKTSEWYEPGSEENCLLYPTSDAFLITDLSNNPFGKQIEFISVSQIDSRISFDFLSSICKESESKVGNSAWERVWDWILINLFFASSLRLWVVRKLSLSKNEETTKIRHTTAYETSRCSTRPKNG